MHIYVLGAGKRHSTVAKVVRKEARHTQRRDWPSGVSLDILEHLPPKKQSLPTLLLCALTSDFTGGCPPPPSRSFWQRVNLQLQLIKFLGKCKVKVKLLSRVRLFATPWIVDCQAPPPMGFSRQEYWSWLPFPSPGDFPDSGIEPSLPNCRQTLYHLSYQGRTWYLTQKPAIFRPAIKVCRDQSWLGPRVQPAPLWKL